jgi:glyoxylase-like metal-dependent hydrolase (beta-lactamase superfamily II)
MEVTKIADGLWRWSAWYEEWRADVGCVYAETDEAVVLIDPLVPPAEAERFWEALDRDVERLGLPVEILITVFWHARSAAEVAHRYGGRIRAAGRARAAVARRTETEVVPLRPGDSLPGAIEAFATGRSSELAYWLPRHNALVPGDVLLGDADGGVRLCPQSWLPATVDQDAVREALVPLLDLPIERILVSHGRPVLEHAHARLAEALAGSRGDHAQSLRATST